MESWWRFWAGKSMGRYYHRESPQIYTTHPRVMSHAAVKKTPFIVLILSKSLKTYFRTPRKTFYESKAKCNMLAIKCDNIIAEAEPRFFPTTISSCCRKKCLYHLPSYQAISFWFSEGGERGNEKSAEVKRIQSCVFFNQEAFLRRAIEEVCWDKTCPLVFGSCLSLPLPLPLPQPKVCGEAQRRAVSGACLPLLLYLLQLAKVL